MSARMFFLVSALVVAAGSQARSQTPAGLAAAALADTSFKWIERQVPGFRVYFLADFLSGRPPGQPAGSTPEGIGPHPGS
jgi:hypothetical protein